MLRNSSLDIFVKKSTKSSSYTEMNSKIGFRLDLLPPDFALNLINFSKLISISALRKRKYL